MEELDKELALDPTAPPPPPKSRGTGALMAVFGGAGGGGRLSPSAQAAIARGEG